MNKIQDRTNSPGGYKSAILSPELSRLLSVSIWAILSALLCNCTLVTVLATPP